jgi:hypothetical protein
MRLAPLRHGGDIPSGHALRVARRATAMMNPLLAPELLKARQQKLVREAEVDRLIRSARVEMPNQRGHLLARLAGLLAMLVRQAPRDTEPAAPAIPEMAETATR